MEYTRGQRNIPCGKNSSSRDVSGVKFEVRNGCTKLVFSKCGQHYGVIYDVEFACTAFSLIVMVVVFWNSTAINAAHKPKG
jgi:hypothetical protein